MVPPFARLSPNAALQRYRRWPRPWRWLLRGLLIAYLLYLLLGNVFLNTPLFDMATNRKPEKFRMQTGPALTVLPGFVTAWDLRMRGHVQRNVWSLRADRASARIALLPLLHRELRLPWMEAVNVIGEIDRVADTVPPPPQSDQCWTLRLDAIHSGTLRRARIGELAIEGKGHGTVGFLKQLKGGPAQLFPSQIVFDDASGRYGKRQMDARFSFPRYYRAQAPGLRKLGIADLALQLHGRSVALRIDTAGAQTRLSTEPGLGQVEANLRLCCAANCSRAASSTGVFRCTPASAPPTAACWRCCSTSIATSGCARACLGRSIRAACSTPTCASPDVRCPSMMPRRCCRGCPARCRDSGISNR